MVGAPDEHDVLHPLPLHLRVQGPVSQSSWQLAPQLTVQEPPLQVTFAFEPSWRVQLLFWHQTVAEVPPVKVQLIACAHVTFALSPTVPEQTDP